MKKLLFTAAVAAIVYVPIAHAGGRPDDRAVGPRSIVASVSTRPDDRAGIRAPAYPVLVRIQSSPSSGFDWGDGAIGAAAASGTLLLTVGLALLALRWRGRIAV
jgi:hypothetical protein